ncbi:MAG: hypothetical protein AAFZ58_09685 [Pseudomonadota bacterium]
MLFRRSLRHGRTLVAVAIAGFTLTLGACAGSTSTPGAVAESKPTAGAAAAPATTEVAAVQPERRPTRPPNPLVLERNQYVDNIWSVVPDDGNAHVRLTFRLDGKRFPGRLSFASEFVFRAIDRENERMVNVGLNPNLNGRWVYEGLPPGTYDLLLVGSRRFAGWEWEQSNVTVDANTAPEFVITLAVPE